MENGEVFGKKGLKNMYSKVDHIPLIKEIARGLKRSKNNKRYLELGIAKAKCFNVIARYFNESTAVDISEKALGYIDVDCFKRCCKTSEFFNDNKEKFDLIFVDADHHYCSVERDFLDSLNCLSEDGVIIMHDTYAPNEFYADHCEDAWKIQDYLINRKDLQFINLPVFYGLTIVKRHNKKEYWKK